MTRIDIDALKEAAQGRWPDILRHLAPELVPALEQAPRHVLCPLQGHDDASPSFRIDKPAEGRAICSCGSYDGIALLRKLRGWTFMQVARAVAEFLGIEPMSGSSPAEEIGIVERVAKLKNIPLDAFMAYGAHAALRGKTKVARIPIYSATGEQVSHFDIPADGGKGWIAKDGEHGLFLPHSDGGKPRMPQPGEQWLVCEGPKDAPALHALGYLVAGLCTSNLAAKLTLAFQGVDVVIVPDLDAAGMKGAEQTARRLLNVARAVKTARLPGEVVDRGGDDARDVLRKHGEEGVRGAITAAAAFVCHDPEAKITNAQFEIVIDEEGNEKPVITPHSMPQIIQAIYDVTDGWPRRVDDCLFTYTPEEGISWLPSSAALFGWLGVRSGAPVNWYRRTGCASKDEVFSELRRSATRYTAVETFPHLPPIDGHFYACQTPPPGDGEALRWLIDRFNPETPIDRDLIQAAIMTLFWGGPPGTRPAFIITSKDGRGVGKSKLVEMLSDLVGGALQFDSSDSINEMKTRLLSPDALTKRVAWIDNIKTHKFSWAELEGLITSPTISGKRMYHGDGSRPNTLVWMATLNGVSLSTDMAQRSVLIKLKRPDRSASWEEDTRAFIRENRNRIIADVVALFAEQPMTLERFSRWATWEREILARTAEPAEAQKVIAERQLEADVDLEDAEITEESFATMLNTLHYDAQTSRVFIPSKVAWHWHTEATGERMSQNKANRAIGQLCDEGRTTALRRNLCKTWGRGFIWDPPKADAEETIRLDLEERIVRNANKF